MKTLLTVLLGLVLVTGCATPSPQAPAPKCPCSGQCHVQAPVLVVFRSQWCPACKAAEPYIAQMQAHVVVRIFDCDERPDLVKQYGVPAIPLFIYGEHRTNDPQVALSWFE